MVPPQRAPAALLNCFPVALQRELQWVGGVGGGRRGLLLHCKDCCAWCLPACFSCCCSAGAVVAGRGGAAEEQEDEEMRKYVVPAGVLFWTASLWLCRGGCSLGGLPRSAAPLQRLLRPVAPYLFLPVAGWKSRNAGW